LYLDAPKEKVIIPDGNIRFTSKVHGIYQWQYIYKI
jgi:hypothetical protein